MAQKFVYMFTNEMKKQICNIWGLRPSEFGKNTISEICVSANGEPMYRLPDYCENVIAVIREFLRENTETALHGYAEEAFTNCGDTVTKWFVYNVETHVLPVETRSAELPYINDCEECGYECEDDEYIARMETHEEGQVYVCPECGEKIEFKVYISRENIIISE